MTPAFALTLDTTPPQLGWDAPHIAAGQGFDVPYTLDEPQLVSVALSDDTGTLYPLVVTNDSISGVLPRTRRALALRAYVRDSVGNDATYNLPLTAAQAALRTLVRITDSLKTTLGITDG